MRCRLAGAAWAHSRAASRPSASWPVLQNARRWLQRWHRRQHVDPREAISELGAGGRSVLQPAARSETTQCACVVGVPLRPLSTRVGVKAARPYTRPAAVSMKDSDSEARRGPVRFAAIAL
eukprot:scaffold70235_cov36-Phaeocystis_antarctica.AAC.2